MALTISNNGAVQRASYHLGKAQDNLQISIRRLASGKRILGPSDDPGTLAVAMKVRASINRLSGAQNNSRNGIGFLEVQDGILETAGKILMRISELKGYATQDPLKSATDVASYNNEFKDLQQQLYDISEMEFNGQSLFADASSTGGAAYFGGANQRSADANMISIFTSAQGSAGTKVLIHRSLLRSALTVRNSDGATAYKPATTNPTDALEEVTWASVKGFTNKVGETTSEVEGGDANINGAYITFAKDSSSANDLLSLENVSTAAIEGAIENLVFLRAQTGAGMSRLQFSAESIATQETNMKSALGRIEDVDIAMESANLAKYSILMQASAAMVAQANMSNDVALMLLR
jgi:flagellin